MARKLVKYLQTLFLYKYADDTLSNLNFEVEFDWRHHTSIKSYNLSKSFFFSGDQLKTQQVEEMLSTLNSTTRPLSSLINSTNISAFNSTEGNNNNENKKSDNITDKNGMSIK